MFMPSVSDSVARGIMFPGCPSVRSFVCSFVRSCVQTDLVTTISHECLEESQ